MVTIRKKKKGAKKYKKKPTIAGMPRYIDCLNVNGPMTLASCSMN
jgi:hypothetical protein